MTRTITIRLPGPAARRVHDRAKSLGITPSELVRAALEKEVGGAEGERTALELTRKWVGCVESRAAPRGRDARRELDDWSPDRRG